MDTHARRFANLVLIVGILDVLAGIGLYVGGSLAVGLAWLGSFDLYVELDKGNVIDHAKLSTEYPELVDGYNLGHRLIDTPLSAGIATFTIGAVLLVVSGIVLCAAAIVVRRRNRVASSATAAATRSPET